MVDKIIEALRAGPQTPMKKLVLQDLEMHAAHRNRRSLLGNASSGIDPQIVQAGITLAGYHIETGARTFAVYAKAMVADLGDIVKPYLKQWYMAVRYDPRLTEEIRKGMTPVIEVDTADVEAVLAEAIKGGAKL